MTSRRVGFSLTSATLLAGLALSFSAGCGGGSKSDGVIEAAPEAQQAAEAISQQYAQQYGEQYGKKGGAR
jgi:hypothetical protein